MHVFVNLELILEIDIGLGYEFSGRIKHVFIMIIHYCDIIDAVVIDWIKFNLREASTDRVLTRLMKLDFGCWMCMTLVKVLHSHQ